MHLAMTFFPSSPGKKNLQYSKSRFCSAPNGTHRPHRIRLLGGGFHPIERRCVSFAHRLGARTEQETAIVPVSVRWYPRPGCDPALSNIPHDSFRHVVAAGNCCCCCSENPGTRYMVAASRLDTTYGAEQQGEHTQPQVVTPLPPFGSAIAAVRASTALPQARYRNTPAPLKIITDLESALRALRRGDNPWFPKAFGSNCPAGSRRYRDTDLARMNAPSI